ncbi:13488_t:CDS:2, partial [Racocetra persica]
LLGLDTGNHSRCSGFRQSTFVVNKGLRTPIKRISGSKKESVMHPILILTGAGGAPWCTIKIISAQQP